MGWDATTTGTSDVEDSASWFAGDGLSAWMGQGSLSAVGDLTGDGLPEFGVAQPGATSFSPGGVSVGIFSAGPL